MGAAIADRMAATDAADRTALDRARALLSQGRAEAALAVLLPGLGQRADDPEMLDCAAMCYWRLGDGATALALMQVVTDGWPRLVDGWTKRAAMAAASGDRALAESCLRKALTLRAHSIPALAALNRVVPFSRNGSLTRRLRAALKDRNVSPADRVMGLNALARIEARAGRHAAAFRHFAASKSAGGAQYHPAEIDRRVAAQIAQYDPAVLNGAPDGPKVIFIVGMPRSGTTLTESILTRHPEVMSAGESRALSQITRNIVAGGDLWGTLAELAPDSALAAQMAYLQALGLPGSAKDRVLVDKMPLNALDIGVAQWMLPQARFVFMNRHPMDIGLSCFSTNFHEGNGFSHRLDWIGHLTRAVHRSAADYHDKLGTAFRWQSYRALVEAPEREIRALLDHAGLDFHDDCLHPEQGQGLARTASMYQVREKINRKGLDTWQAYARDLASLCETLEPDWLTQWESRDADACSPG